MWLMVMFLKFTIYIIVFPEILAADALYFGGLKVHTYVLMP